MRIGRGQYLRLDEKIKSFFASWSGGECFGVYCGAAFELLTFLFAFRCALSVSDFYAKRGLWCARRPPRRARNAETELPAKKSPNPTVEFAKVKGAVALHSVSVTGRLIVQARPVSMPLDKDTGLQPRKLARRPATLVERLAAAISPGARRPVRSLRRRSR
jgi:hypothetical protein